MDIDVYLGAKGIVEEFLNRLNSAVKKSNVFLLAILVLLFVIDCVLATVIP